jgi:hypothetical protein
MEALALTDAGMPPDAFTFVFQCDSLPKRSAQVFERLKQDASWQTAFQTRFLEGGNELVGLVGEGHVLGSTDIYVSHDFPNAVRMLCNGTSLIKCDFDLNNSCDVHVHRLVEAARDWDLSEWNHNRREQCSPVSFNTEAPLPAWLDLRREDLVEFAHDDEGN